MQCDDCGALQYKELSPRGKHWRRLTSLRSAAAAHEHELPARSSTESKLRRTTRALTLPFCRHRTLRVMGLQDLSITIHVQPRHRNCRSGPNQAVTISKHLKTTTMQKQYTQSSTVSSLLQFSQIVTIVIFVDVATHRCVLKSLCRSEHTDQQQQHTIGEPVDKQHALCLAIA